MRKRKAQTHPPVVERSTQELSPRTWPDFEQLFESHPAPGAYPCRCMYNHRCGPLTKAERAESSAQRTVANRRAQRALVEGGASHGILVFHQGQAVGWCQYGTADELPRVASQPIYRRLVANASTGKLWRITCFLTHRKYRGQGIARTALKAALRAIEKKGGGMVEAYPIRRWGAYAEYRGTLAMFQAEGFKVVAPLGRSNLLVRKII